MSALRRLGAMRWSSGVPTYPGANASVSKVLQFLPDVNVAPMYRVMDEEGQLLDKAHTIPMKEETMVKIYETMSTVNIMDLVGYDSQRQGRMSFYMTNYGEEAAQVGSAAALDAEDVLFLQYREAGVVLWRGFTIEDMSNQLFGNDLDYGKGRQMPVHYGSRKLNIQTISSPLGTQLPQAAGAAYALKRDGNGKCAVCYFGEGAASEGDFHAAMNFAATLDCPVLFFCRNNGIAISTPSSEQYRGDGIASRGPSYGVKSIRVDGNDMLAVYEATAMARQYAVENNAPVLIEAMTYRGGHHSTSDDSTRYRSPEDIQLWKEKNNPILRLRSLLESKGLWDQDKEDALLKSVREQVVKSMAAAEKRQKPPIDDLFNDVYESVPPHLLEQKAELMEHLAKYPDEYKTELYKDA